MQAIRTRNAFVGYRVHGAFYNESLLTDLSLRKRLDVLLGLLTVDEGQVSVRGGAQGLDDQLELINVVLAREQWLSLQQFCQDATHRPAKGNTHAYLSSLSFIPSFIHSFMHSFIHPSIHHVFSHTGACSLEKMRSF